MELFNNVSNVLNRTAKFQSNIQAHRDYNENRANGMSRWDSSMAAARSNKFNQYEMTKFRSFKYAFYVYILSIIILIVCGSSILLSFPIALGPALLSLMIFAAYFNFKATVNENMSVINNDYIK